MSQTEQQTMLMSVSHSSSIEAQNDDDQCRRALQTLRNHPSALDPTSSVVSLCPHLSALVPGRRPSSSTSVCMTSPDVAPRKLLRTTHVLSMAVVSTCTQRLCRSSVSGMHPARTMSMRHWQVRRAQDPLPPSHMHARGCSPGEG